MKLKNQGFRLRRNGQMTFLVGEDDKGGFVCEGRTAGRGVAIAPISRFSTTSHLALRLPASQLLDLLLFLSAGSRAGRLGSGFLAGGALDLLAFQFVFHFARVCHV